MPNMSYCRFQNTAPDLKDCVDALQLEGFDVLSAKEQQAALQIKRLRQEYLDAWEDA